MPFFRIVLDAINVRTLTRVGNRDKYEIEFPSENNAKEHLSAVLQKLHVNANPFSETQDKRLASQKVTKYNLRLEDALTGISLEIRTETLTINLVGPDATELRKHVPKDRFTFVADIDIFSVKPVAVEDFLPQELLRSNQKMAETRILPLLT